MTKQKHRILALTFLLWTLDSNAELGVRFTDDSSTEKTSLRLSLTKTANDFWFSEEQAWKVTPKDQSIEISFSLVSGDHLAQTAKNKINFNVHTPTDDMASTLKHEVAHIFMSTQCPKLQDPFMHELYAYWRSQDYSRLLYGQNSIYSKSEAYKNLRDRAAFNPSKAVSTARLINELVKKEKESVLNTWFFDLFRQCQNPDFLDSQRQLTSKFLDTVQNLPATQSASNDWGFTIFDSVANEVIDYDGKWQKKQPVGSTLKPLLLSFFSDIRKNKVKKNNPEWDCGDREQTNWNFKDALAYSCNGFFLDSQIMPSELSKYVETLNTITGSEYSSRWLNMADLIGLWPTIKLTLLDVVKIYDYILENNPETISILKQTSVKGTLAGADESKWFHDKGIALKSGTTTLLDLSIDTGFVVAVLNAETIPKIAVLYRSGVRPLDLLREMKMRLTPYVEHKDSKAQVQVLSSFNPNSVEIHCPSFVLKNGKKYESNTVNLASGIDLSSRFSCVGAPFEVKPQDQVTRKLYGDLTFRKTEANETVANARSEKNARARMGSQIILNTTEWHYLKSVFFSESTNYRQELKKAFLLVIKNNLEFWNQKKQPICDTTICQVFNLNYETVPQAQKKSINDLILALGSLHVDSQKWLEFSLGGNDNWAKSVALEDVVSFLKDSSSLDISGKRNGDEFQFELGSQNIVTHSCEKTRSFFKLRSCPTSLEKNSNGDYRFIGQGEGHDRGMNLSEANQLAIQGFNFDQILDNYYKVKVKPKHD